MYTYSHTLSRHDALPIAAPSTVSIVDCASAGTLIDSAASPIKPSRIFFIALLPCSFVHACWQQNVSSMRTHRNLVQRFAFFQYLGQSKIRWAQSPAMNTRLSVTPETVLIRSDKSDTCAAPT